MKTIQGSVTAYRFDELSQTAKEKVIKEYRERWHRVYRYDDIQSGLNIEANNLFGFSFDDIYWDDDRSEVCIDGDFTAGHVKDRVIPHVKEWGEDERKKPILSAARKLVKRFQNHLDDTIYIQLNGRVSSGYRITNSEHDDYVWQREDEIREFVNAINGYLADFMEKDIEWRTSEEYIQQYYTEDLEAWFDVLGNLIELPAGFEEAM